MNLGLYIHIPFCKSKCAYCDFYSLARSEDRMDAYLDALERQLAAWAERAAAHTVDTVYFGGGTPSCLGAARLTRALEGVLRRYRVDAGAEITLEANPESARDADALRTLRGAGFNRISLGAQSFDDATLAVLGRIHTCADTRAAVAAARRAGFDNLSLDLMYGLPGQDLARWRADLDAACALEPEHLSCYGLKIESGTPFAARRGALDLPDDDAQAEQYLAAVDFLARRGWRQYEISNFARPGRASRHNLKYWTLGEYLGFGPGAHSDFGGRRFALARDLTAYLSGKEVCSEDAAISARERAAERVMLGLRTAEGLPESLLAGAADVLDACESHGLVARGDGRRRLTPEGFLVSNDIILRVLDALEGTECSS